MLPINDTEPNRYTSFPFMVIAIIIVNCFVFTYEFFVLSDTQLNQIFYEYGSVPAFTMDQFGGGALTAITYQFLHGGFGHIAGNMLGVWVFGRRVEDVCGPWRFLVFYLICGVFANLIFIATDFRSEIPLIGASGALYGVMGAYLLLYPRGRIRTAVFYFGIAFPKLRAYWVVLFFFIFELPPAYDALVNGSDYGVAHWAHLGGFITSLTIFFFLSPLPYHNYRNDLPL